MLHTFYLVIISYGLFLTVIAEPNSEPNGEAKPANSKLFLCGVQRRDMKPNTRVKLSTIPSSTQVLCGILKLKSQRKTLGNRRCIFFNAAVGLSANILIGAGAGAPVAPVVDSRHGYGYVHHHHAYGHGRYW